MAQSEQTQTGWIDQAGDQLWKLFSSVRLTIALLLFLMGWSVAGTLIAQQATTSTPLTSLYSTETLRWMVRFGLTDIFHSPYFVAGLLCLALNLIICSFDRLPGVWRQAFLTPILPCPIAVFEEGVGEHLLRKQKLLVVQHKLSIELSSDSFQEWLTSFLQKKSGRKGFVSASNGGLQGYWERGKYSRLGVYITHLSLLLIMTGAVIGAVFGFEGAMQIEEGTRSSWIQHNKGSRLGMRPFRENGATLPGLLALPFEVSCDHFTLETYDGTRPKLFKSVLSFYENDVKVATREIKVNEPTVYRGLTFYQASFVEEGLGKANLKVFRGSQSSPIDSSEFVAEVGLNDLYRIDGDAAFRVIQIEKDVMGLGPAIHMQFFPTKVSKKPKEFWIFKELPGFDFAHRRDSQLHFVLDSVTPKFATGLSVARDPGVWVVWIGSLILVLALFLALYTHHSRMWFCLDPDGRSIRFVGWSNKLFLFEPKFEKQSEHFREFLEGRLAKGSKEG